MTDEQYEIELRSMIYADRQHLQDAVERKDNRAVKLHEDAMSENVAELVKLTKND